MAGLYTHTTRGVGTVLSATIYNDSHQNHINNRVPAFIDDYGESVLQYRLNTDGGEAGSESLATSLAGEIERLRFAIKEVKGFVSSPGDEPPEWYVGITSQKVNVPAGMMIMYGGSTLPASWLECDGAAVSRTTFADLFAAIGTTYGAGDGSTTFNLPDNRSRIPIGSGQGAGLTLRTIGGSGGEELHVISSAEMGVHNHAFIESSHAHTLTAASAGAHTHNTETTGTFGGGLTKLFGVGDGLTPNTATIAGAALAANSIHTHTHTTATATSNITVTATGSGGGHNNVSPVLAVRFLIKT